MDCGAARATAADRLLRYYADLDYRQIATVLDIAVGTVSATLSAAHQTLRKTIEEVPQ